MNLGESPFSSIFARHLGNPVCLVTHVLQFGNGHEYMRKNAIGDQVRNMREGWGTSNHIESCRPWHGLLLFYLSEMGSHCRVLSRGDARVNGVRPF